MLAVHSGQLVWLTFPFADANGVPTDPATIALSVQDPSGNDTEYTLAGLVKDSVGNYHLALTPATPGLWSWHVASTGPVQAADDGQFLVLPALA